MPITYEPTDRLVRYYGQKLRKLSPHPFDLGAFTIGVVTGYIILPIVLPIVGIKLWKWAAK
jgi:hypothetical protein